MACDDRVYPRHSRTRGSTSAMFLATRLAPSLRLVSRATSFKFTQTSSATRAMSSSTAESAARPPADQVVQDIANYVHDYKVSSDIAWETARLCLIDTIGCGLEGLRFKECARLLGPVVEGTTVPNGSFILHYFWIVSK